MNDDCDAILCLGAIFYLKSCFGVSVAVSAWSAGVGQHLNGLQMENTPRRQKAYSVNRMKTASGTREYITCDHIIVKLKYKYPQVTSRLSRLRSSSVMAMLGSR